MTERCFVGIDWATQEHAACVIDANGKVLGERMFKHSGEGLCEMCAWILATGGADAGATEVAIEVPHGPVVETLLERGMIVHAINPKQLDRFRDRFTVAGAKDDRRDAYVLADSLRTDAQAFRLLKVDDRTVIELREWSRMAEEVQQERTRLGNRLRQQLLRYYPQILELDDDVAGEFVLSLWELVPTPAVAATTREPRLRKVLRKHRIRRFDAAHALTVLRQEPLHVAPGTTEACVAHISALLARLRLLNRQHKDSLRRIDALTEKLASHDDADSSGESSERRDVEILRSLPGVGRIVLATLLAEASQPLKKRDYHGLRMLVGVAPVTKQSGKHRRVTMRHACHARLRTAVFHWARIAAIYDPKSRAAYAELRSRGHSHGRSLRSVSDRLLRLACAMLREGSLYDVSRRQVGPPISA